VRRRSRTSGGTKRGHGVMFEFAGLVVRIATRGGFSSVPGREKLFRHGPLFIPPHAWNPDNSRLDDAEARHAGDRSCG